MIIRSELYLTTILYIPSQDQLTVIAVAASPNDLVFPGASDSWCRVNVSDFSI